MLPQTCGWCLLFSDHGKSSLPEHQFAIAVRNYYNQSMWLPGSGIRRLRTELENVDIDLGDLRTETSLIAARTELEIVRSGKVTPSPRSSIAQLESRKHQLEEEIENIQSNRNHALLWLGLSLWTIAGIYALVWLQNIAHPEWAIATTVAIGSILGFVATGFVALLELATWMNGY